MLTWYIPIKGDYSLTAKWGQRGKHWKTYHTGQDFAAPTGTQVVASAAGLVVENNFNSAYGNQIVILHANGAKTRYAHLHASYVNIFQPVKGGEVIGTVGATGNATGAHLHFEMIIGGKTVDPMRYLGGDAPADTPTKPVPGTEGGTTPQAMGPLDLTAPGTWMRVAYFLGGMVMLLLALRGVIKGGLK